MARERYLLDDTEDTIHENEIKPQTAADKRKNWWDYHKVHVLLVVLAIAVVGYFIYSVTSKTEPDYTITVMTTCKPIFRSFSRNMQTTATVTAKHTSP